MKSWIQGSEIDEHIDLIGDDNAEYYRKALIDYVNQYQDECPSDYLEEVWLYMQIKSETGDMDFTAVPDEIIEAIEIGRYEYCFSLNEIASAYKILVKPQPITCTDIKSFANHMLEAFSCYLPEDAFFNQEIQRLKGILAK
ncbi:hypothetical protein [Xenorhabdus innexi]|uniref:Uncharacterized protein n=1 Tax=Xenorhabdus innexi TaxID=290109 RepID=A0A1N6N211_9GAMM|nr:hypothetical protein [Xenorhabdus innexi]PHM29436.1 hypothetical protein Xinn_03704 [Xenorhabdus innexi]SIP75148.1 conserved hypothetical protein [Xenorhabdus innexi]